MSTLTTPHYLDARSRAPVFLRRAHHGDLISLAALAETAAGRFSSARSGLRQLASNGSGPLGLGPALIDEGTLWVAHGDGRIVACAAWTRRADEPAYPRLSGFSDGHPAGLLRCLLVNPVSSGLGCARRMTEWVEREAHAADVRRSLVLAAVHNAPMYARMGYRPLYDFHHSEGGLRLPGLAMCRDLAQQAPWQAAA